MNDARHNILFFLPDQWRPDFLGFVGSQPVRTPHVDELARRGTVFTRATTPSPLCAPARACLAAGLSYRASPVANNSDDFPLDRPTLYSRLRDAGYQTGSVGKLDLHKATLRWGTDGQRSMDAWGFTHGRDSEGKLDAVRSYIESGREPQGPYMAFLAERGLADAHAADFGARDPWLGTDPTPLPADAYCDNWIGGSGIETIRSFDADRPWFLVVNFTGPHNPQDVTREMADWYADVQFPAATGNDDLNPEHLNQIRRNYAAMCENIDHWLGRLLEEIETRGESEETIVVFSSDHGEMLGDLNRWGKSVWYQHSIGIPLVVAGPSVARRRRDELVQLQDLTPTFLGAAGAEPLPGADSCSLEPILAGAGHEHSWDRTVAYSGLNEWEARWDGRWKLVLNHGAPVHFYDTAGDPEELVDLLAAGMLTGSAAAARDRLLHHHALDGDL